MRLPFALILALSACSDFPQLDEAVDSEARDAPYPDLVPVETINGAVPENQIDEDTAPDLKTRIKRLRTRALRLKGGVVDDKTRERMEAGIE